MTRKQAILLGISILEKNKKNQEIIEKLKEVAEEIPFKSWNKESVFDAIEQFKIDHNGRIPNAKEFDSRGLPSKSTIQHLFNVTVIEFLNQYYPERLINSEKRYKGKSIYYWLEIFRKKYIEINNGKYVHISVYDKKREKGSPCVQTLMKLFNLREYSELISLAQLDKKYTVSITYKKS